MKEESDREKSEGGSKGGGENSHHGGDPPEPPPASKRNAPDEANNESVSAKKAREDTAEDEPERSETKRNMAEIEAMQEEESWKKKKLNWLKTISKVPGVVPISKVQVVELYSPERVNKVAKERGMVTGHSLDLTTGWNFDKKEDRDLAEKYIR